MSDFYRPSERRVAAKEHRCIYCGETIIKGEIYKEQTGVWDCKAFRNRFHWECFEDLCECSDGEFTPYSCERPNRDPA